MKINDVIRASTPADGLKVKFADACEEYYDIRTTDFTLINNTRYTVKIWFVQGKDTSNTLLPGFSTDTGVYVGVVDGQAYSTSHSDPCRAGGRDQPIQVTEADASVKIIDREGQEQDVIFDKIKAEQGQFFPTVTWRLDEGPVVAKKPEVKVMDRPKKQV
jgi:hypothetical protein